MVKSTRGSRLACIGGVARETTMRRLSPALISLWSVTEEIVKVAFESLGPSFGNFRASMLRHSSWVQLGFVLS